MLCSSPACWTSPPRRTTTMNDYESYEEWEKAETLYDNLALTYIDEHRLDLMAGLLETLQQRLTNLQNPQSSEEQAR